MSNVIAFPASAVKRRPDPQYPAAPLGAVAVPLYLDGQIKLGLFQQALVSAGLHIERDKATRCFVIREDPSRTSSTIGEVHG